jgi:hypothetical protein
MWKPEFCFGDFLPPGAKKNPKNLDFFNSVNSTNFSRRFGGKIA